MTPKHQAAAIADDGRTMNPGSCPNCQLAHEADRVCSQCGSNETVCSPFIHAFWCRDCTSYFGFELP